MNPALHPGIIGLYELTGSAAFLGIGGSGQPAVGTQVAAKATRYRVFYGSYPTRDEAAAALAQLPEEYRKDFRLQIYTLREMQRNT